MSCGGRLNKGAGATIVIPLYVENVDDASVSFYTDGSESVEAESVVIEHGQVVATLSKTDLDLLSDGVLRYTLDYVVDGEEYTISSDTTSYLKTPLGYSAVSLTEVIEEAREDGYAEGEVVGKAEGYVSGYTQGEQVGYDNGYSQGYEQGQADCPECSGGSCTLQDNYEVYLNGTETAGQFPIAPAAGYDGIANGTIYYAEAYQTKYAEGYAAGQADCPECDCSSAITEAYTQGYQSGYTQGQAECPECSGGSSCNLENGEILIFDTFENGDVFYPSNGYDGFSSVTIYDKNYSETWFNSGYTEGYYAAWLYYPSDVFCRLDTGVNIGGTYSVDLHRNNDTHIVNPNYRNEFIILGNCSDSDNCYMQLSLTDDNIIRLILDDTETSCVLSAQTYGEYIHADIIFNESESSVTFNVINHGYDGSMAISLSASGFDWIVQDMAQELVINGEYNDGESEYHPELYPPYYNVATCNIMIDKIVAYDNYGNIEHLWKYKKGCLCDCMTNYLYSFLRCVYHSDLRYWSQDPVEIIGTPFGMGGL